MRLFLLTLLCVAAVSYCEAMTPEELKALADEAGAPFTPVALERLDDDQLWGAERAGRSVDLVIINKSGKTFKLSKLECSRGPRGSPSAGLEAENNLYPHTSTVLGFQSNQDDSDAYIYCDLEYSRSDDVHALIGFHFSPHNVRGDVGMGVSFQSQTPLMSVDHSIDTTKNNYQFVYQVKDRSNDSPFILSQQGAVVRQRKSKGSRNTFVKASKRGNSVRTI